MTDRIPPEPILVAAELIPEVRQALLRVLRDLGDEDWQKPTVCEGWSVKDVALHILGDDVGLLSNLRDQDGQYHEFENWAALVAFIDVQNNSWVQATRRISRGLLLELLAFTGERVSKLLISLDPHQLGGPIGWAGDQPDPMWLHVAREFTEYWTHHQHICEAVGQTSLKSERYLQPLITTFIHALPPTFAEVHASQDTMIQVQITETGRGVWHLVREGEHWNLYQHTDLQPTSVISLDSDCAWRLFTKNQPLEQLKDRITFDGDHGLGKNFLNTVAMITE